MEFFAPTYHNTVTLNDLNFSLIYNSTNDKDRFLQHFQNCMKKLNISYYNSTIHSNVNTMIQIILVERNFYIKENNKLKEEVSVVKVNTIQLEKNIVELKNQLSRSQSQKQLEVENGKLKNQINSFHSHISSLQINYINANKKTQEVKETLNLTVAQYQILFNKQKILETENMNLQEQQKILDSTIANIQNQNKIYTEENIELNSKITVFKQKMKSVKECEEIIGTKNQENVKLQNQINSLHKQISSLQNYIDTNKKAEEIQQTLDKTISKYQTLFNKNKILEDEILELNTEITVLKQKMKIIKECQEIIVTKNDENENQKKEIQDLLKEKAKIIIDFGERELKEQRKIWKLEKKLKDYEIKRNYYISEAEKLSRKLREKENGQSRSEVSRKRPRSAMINDGNQQILHTLNEWSTSFNPPFQQHSEGEQPQHHQQQEQNSQTNIPLISPNNLLSCNSSTKENSNSIPETTESTASKWNGTPKIDAKTRKGYILFATETRKKIIAENSEAGFAEISKMIGIEWNKLSNEQKFEYQFRAETISNERIKYLSQNCKK